MPVHERLKIRGETDGLPREVGRIDSVHLGMEDHGVFTFNLGFDFGGTHQGMGHLILGCPNGKPEPTYHEGAARLLCAVTRVIGNLADAKGKTVFVIRDDDSWGANIIGIQGLMSREPLIFKDVLNVEPEADEVERGS